MTVLRVAGGLLFVVGGGSLVLMSLLGGPSLWYFVSFCALPILGIVWFWKPPLAAALSIGPLISVIALLHYASEMWGTSRIWAEAVVFVPSKPRTALQKHFSSYGGFGSGRPVTRMRFAVSG